MKDHRKNINMQQIPPTTKLAVSQSWTHLQQFCSKVAKQVSQWPLERTLQWRPLRRWSLQQRSLYLHVICHPRTLWSPTLLWTILRDTLLQQICQLLFHVVNINWFSTTVLFFHRFNWFLTAVLSSIDLMRSNAGSGLSTTAKRNL